MTLIVERSARNLSPAELHPAGSCPSCGGNSRLGVGQRIAFREAVKASYRGGIQAGHQDGLAHLEAFIRQMWAELNDARRRRNHSHREMTDFRVWDAVAAWQEGYLQQLLQIRRALKEGGRR